MLIDIQRKILNQVLHAAKVTHAACILFLSSNTIVIVHEGIILLKGPFFISHHVMFSESQWRTLQRNVRMVQGSDLIIQTNFIEGGDARKWTGTVCSYIAIDHPVYLMCRDFENKQLNGGEVALIEDLSAQSLAKVLNIDTLMASRFDGFDMITGSNEDGALLKVHVKTRVL